MRYADRSADRAAARARFALAYQHVVSDWPVPVTQVDVPTDYGTTHLLASGTGDGPPVVALPGSGATATAWSAVAGELSGRRRVVAVDPVGQPGLSTDGGSRLRSPADVTRWLDQVLTGLASAADQAGAGPLSGERVVLAGHSYGAWLALRYALDVPQRVAALVLLDPTECFASLSVRYRLRAAPLLARPRAARLTRFLAWETRGRPLDPAWLEVARAGQDLGRAQVVLPRRPRPAELAGLDRPVLVVTAARSQAHDPALVARRAGELLPHLVMACVPEASHHTLPMRDAGELGRLMEEFLAGQGVA